jgi:drug/metabolite transporter (DMT)-like permease
VGETVGVPRPGVVAREPTIPASAIALLYILLWSSAFIATKVGVSHSPPLTLLSARFLAASALLALLVRARGLAWPNHRRDWVALMLFGFLNSGLYLGFSYEAIRHLSAGMATIISATNPLLLTLVAPRLLGERLSVARVFGLILGFGGVLFVVGARLDGGAGADSSEGVILAFSGVACLVAATVLFKRRPLLQHPLVVNTVQLGSAGLALIVPAALFEHPTSMRLDGPLLWSFVYLVLVISIAASLLWFLLLERGEASVASAYYFLTPIFGLGLAAVLLGESVGPRDLLGLVAVAVGIVLINRS